MKIEIEKIEDAPIYHLGGFRVSCGDRWENLTWDEAIGCVAKLILCGADAKTHLRTAEQHEEWNKRYGPKSEERIAAHNKQLEDKRSAEADAIFPNVKIV